ncbi:MAG: hypothetical protein ABJZ55_13680 [Fuerstiella sp.]
MTTAPESDPDQELTDDVVGKALWLSVAVILLIAVVGIAIWYLRPAQPKEVGVVQEETILPQVRELPELEIPAVPFKDVSIEAGLVFQHTNGANGEKLLPETMGAVGRSLISTTTVTKTLCV